jgi:uncharacterized protein (TIGR03435 family)
MKMFMAGLSRVASGALAIAGILGAQAPAKQKLAYEVTSVKPHAGDDFRIMINLGMSDGGRLNLSGVPLALVIQLAYSNGVMGGPLGPSNGTLAGLPGWAQTDRFDIEARPEPGFRPTQEQAREMMQSLLEERFTLKVHKETKDGPVYDLVVAKDGPKMKLSADQSPIVVAGSGANPGGPPPPPPPPPALGAPFNPGAMPRGMMMNGPGLLRGTAQNAAGLARLLSSQAGRQVIDKTGLTGLYDFELRFAPSQPMQLPPGALPPGVTLPEADPTAPSIFTAVQEQLGLKLESSKAPLESIVVDHVEKPTAN